MILNLFDLGTLSCTKLASALHEIFRILQEILDAVRVRYASAVLFSRYRIVHNLRIHRNFLLHYLWYRTHDTEEVVQDLLRHLFTEFLLTLGKF
jgi:hypothetical protein